MKKHTYKPKWRHAKEAVELVLFPDEDWFVEAGTHVRFSLMQDGDLWFGDAETVLHRDICLFEKADGCGPLLVGVLMRHQGKWRIGNVQWFMRDYGRRGTEMASAFLRHLTNWSDAASSMGNDPTDQPSLEQELGFGEGSP